VENDESGWEVMTFNESKTIGAIAVENPTTIQAFEKFGIDYCCGGNKLLIDACSSAGVEIEEIKAYLEDIERFQKKNDAGDFQKISLSELLSYIVETHHKYTKNAMHYLDDLMLKVCKAHSEKHSEVTRLYSLYCNLCADLIPHMMKEELVLFPYVAKLEEDSKKNSPSEMPPFGTVKNPIRAMLMEHDTAGEILRNMREVTDGYKLPEDACNSYRALYYELEEFEKDLHMHIHLENNVLFPRAIELERRCRG
jgi:regulator of cell morphogenesis and NO signaling